MTPFLTIYSRDWIEIRNIHSPVISWSEECHPTKYNDMLSHYNLDGHTDMKTLSYENILTAVSTCKLVNCKYNVIKQVPHLYDMQNFTGKNKPNNCIMLKCGMTCTQTFATHVHFHITGRYSTNSI